MRAYRVTYSVGHPGDSEIVNVTDYIVEDFQALLKELEGFYSDDMEISTIELIARTSKEKK